MRNLGRTFGLAFSCILAVAWSASAGDSSQPAILFDFGADFDASTVATNDAKAAVTSEGTLRIEMGHQEPWPGVTLKAPQGKWDLSRYEYVSLDVTNRSDRPVTVYCRVDNPGADGTDHCVTDQVSIDPDASQTLTVRIFPVPWKLDKPLELIGMRGYPVHAGKIDTANVTQLVIFLTRPMEDRAIEIDNIRAGGQIQVVDASTFLPFIDEYGQYIHKEWPGKVRSVAGMLTHSREELEDLRAHTRPQEWNKYGGWADGPRLKATGFFRVQKHRGKWWLVDPLGRLFWSHGIDCVHSGDGTPITDRESYYRGLPSEDSPFVRFYGQGSWAPHGYYSEHSPYKTYDFGRANLLRKYGEDSEAAFADITHRRLESWGVNTIANWSDERVYLLRLTPYVATIHFEARRLEGSEGYWGKFYDVFDPTFQDNLRNRLESERGKTVDDPWCIGYFVHNELSWGDDTSLAVAALVSPADQPAKIAFVNDLEARYGTIESLNQAWGTRHESWESLLQSREAPDRAKAGEDLQEFYTKTAETYFGTIRRELKRVAPKQLYLGCRFAWVNDRAGRAATKFCDVVSYNRYEYSVGSLKLPDEIDMPIVIGEFHFGALDRGLFHTGLRRTESQEDRAAKYRSYLESALRNPCIVGTHWFQYKDQPTTGRGDGENYQIGFVDICDTPYPEIVKAARDVGYSMYERRFDEY
ncbi:MAG: beta-galactosidase [Phycisphaerales bacterium]